MRTFLTVMVVIVGAIALTAALAAAAVMVLWNFGAF